MLLTCVTYVSMLWRSGTEFWSWGSIVVELSEECAPNCHINIYRTHRGERYHLFIYPRDRISAYAVFIHMYEIQIDLRLAKKVIGFRFNDSRTKRGAEEIWLIEI